ncbi:MAG: hypothetical protein ACU0FH_08700 [Heliomarina sp.]|uniref:hypothetical protein n=1 Tax=Heliomarina sp. TaxID=2917556 RepID=UPI00405A2814
MGTYDLLNQMLGQALLDIYARTRTPVSEFMIQQSIRPDLKGLIDVQSPTDVGDVVVPTVFASLHPSVVDRLLFVSERLRQSPGSTFRSDPSGAMSFEKMQWGLLKRKTCEEAKANR